jgi:RND family efflux transporter MFP subunit
MRSEMLTAYPPTRPAAGTLAWLALALALAGCGRDPDAFSAPKSQTFDSATVRVELHEVPQHYTATGTVVSDERVEISSRTTAYLRALNVREGERVKKGQVLARLDSQDLDGRTRAATAQRDQALANAADARRDVADSSTLFSRGLVAEAHQRKAKLALAAASEALNASEAELARLQAERQYTQIVSPVEGVVVQRQRRAGDLVTPGMPLLTVESDTALLFQTQIPEQRVTDVKIGDPVLIRVDALGKSITGEVLRRVASGDPVTRGFEIKISLPGESGLLPGMFGRAEFEIDRRRCIVVPVTAMVERGGLPGVFVVDGDNRLGFRWIRTAHVTGDGVVVEAGLDAGEEIVRTASNTMRDGDTLRRPASP